MQDLGQLIAYLVRNIFMEKVYRKSALKTNVTPLFNFDKYHETKQQMHKRNVSNISNILAYHIWNILNNIIISIITWLILSFSFYRPLLEMMIKSNPRVYDLINSLKKNLKTLFDILRRILDLIFLTTICLYHDQLWVIIEGSTSLTRYWSLHCNNADPKVSGDLTARLGCYSPPRECWVKIV